MNGKSSGKLKRFRRTCKDTAANDG